MRAATKQREGGHFDRVIEAFGDRFLSAHTFDFVLAPALADYQFDRDQRNVGEWESRCGVLVALIGALRIDIGRNAAAFLLLSMVPACYYMVLLALWSDFFSMDGVVKSFSVMILVVSVVSVALCFWPDRRVARSSR